MKRTLAMMLWAAGAALGAGCHSRAAGTEAYADAEAIDSTTTETGEGDRDQDGGTDSDTMKPPPVAGEGNLLLFRGRAELLANGTPCTGEAGATGDRWCAFISPSTSSLGGVNLFVVNASRAAAGAAITCGGGVVDPNCLKLTGGFFEESVDPFPHAAGFTGDTLIYFDQTGTGYGWRPGMTNGRVLADGGLHDCLSSQTGSAVLCLRDLNSPSATAVTRSELLVGDLAKESAPALTPVDVVISADPAVKPPQLGLRMGFGPTGADVAWSSRAVSGGPEILKTQRVGDTASQVTVASDVSRWRLSPDGTRWYWLSHYNYDVAGMPSGTLQVAPFPSGAAPTTLLPEVGIYSVTPTGAVVAQTRIIGSRGTLRAIPDPLLAPSTVTSIDSGVLRFFSSGARGHIAYTKASDGVFGFFDLYVKKLDGTGGLCALTSQALAPPAVIFLPSGAGVMWARVTNLDEPFGTPFRFRVSLTRLADCVTMPVALDVSGFATIGDDRVLLEDDYDGVDGRLRAKVLAAEGVVGPASPVLIQSRVTRFVPVASEAGLVVFTVNAGSAQDGLYLYVVNPPSTLHLPGPGGRDDGANDVP